MSDTSSNQGQDTLVVDTVTPNELNSTQGESTSAKEQINTQLKEAASIPAGVSEYAANILKGMSPDDIARFAPKLAEWDAGVTERFNKIHEEYKPFKGLNPSEVTEALQLDALIKQNPAQALEYLQSMITPSETVEEDQELTSDEELYNSLDRKSVV